MLPLSNCYVTSPYGVIRSNGKVHTGIDLISTSGDRNVKAIARGIYRGAYYDKNGYGNYVIIENDDGLRTIYAHLQKVNLDVPIGTRIEAGTVIGIEGTTGNSTGIHLHLEIRKSPYDYNSHLDIARYLGIANVKGPVQILPFEEEVENNMLEMLKRLAIDYGEDNVEKGLRRMIETFIDDGEPAPWAIAEVEAAKEAGITDGTHPEMWTTRQETMIMCYRTLQLAKKDIEQFANGV